MTRDETIAALRQALSTQSEVRLALLFGSVARDLAREDSDVDLAIALAPGADPLDLAAHLSRATGREVDLVRLDNAGIPLQQELVRHAVPVHEAYPGAAAMWRSHTLADLDIDGPWFKRMQDAWLRRVAERGLLDG